MIIWFWTACTHLSTVVFTEADTPFNVTLHGSNVTVDRSCEESKVLDITCHGQTHTTASSTSGGVFAACHPRPIYGHLAIDGDPMGQGLCRLNLSNYIPYADRLHGRVANMTLLNSTLHQGFNESVIIGTLETTLGQRDGTVKPSTSPPSPPSRCPPPPVPAIPIPEPVPVPKMPYPEERIYTKRQNSYRGFCRSGGCIIVVGLILTPMLTILSTVTAAVRLVADVIHRGSGDRSTVLAALIGGTGHAAFMMSCVCFVMGWIASYLSLANPNAFAAGYTCFLLCLLTYGAAMAQPVVIALAAKTTGVIIGMVSMLQSFIVVAYLTAAAFNLARVRWPPFDGSDWTWDSIDTPGWYILSPPISLLGYVVCCIVTGCASHCVNWAKVGVIREYHPAHMTHTGGGNYNIYPEGHFEEDVLASRARGDASRIATLTHWIFCIGCWLLMSLAAGFLVMNWRGGENQVGTIAGEGSTEWGHIEPAGLVFYASVGICVLILLMGLLCACSFHSTIQLVSMGTERLSVLDDPDQVIPRSQVDMGYA